MRVSDRVVFGGREKLCAALGELNTHHLFRVVWRAIAPKVTCPPKPPLTPRHLTRFGTWAHMGCRLIWRREAEMLCAPPSVFGNS